MQNMSRQMTEEFISRFWSEKGAMPKHERLKRAFSESIKEGFWRAGTRLPTEAGLVEASPCSLGTVQRALRELAADGLIERRRGSGSVVADLDGKLSDPWHIRYVKNQVEPTEYYTIHTKVLSRDLKMATGPWSKILDQNDTPIVKVDRIFTVASGKNIYAEFYALASRFPEFLELPLSDMDGLNFKQMIGKRYKSPTHKVHQTLRFLPTPDHVAEACGTPNGGISPILNVVSYPLNGEPIYYQDFYLPIEEGELDLGVAVRSLA
jgi:GntR family transcriptional regulator